MYNPFQMNPYMMNFRQPFINQQQFITKQVTSIEEARASMVDPLSTYLFVDSSTGYIYLKRMNNNGLSDFFIYKPDENKQGETPLDLINNRLSNIEKMLGGSDDKSISDKSKSINDATVTESESTVVQQGSANGKWKI